MAKKSTSAAAVPKPAAPATATASTSSTSSNTAVSAPAPTTPVKPTFTSLSPKSSPQEILFHVWNKYVNETPSRTLLLDIFMLFLVVNGGIQFLYCVIGGNYPFNAFLSGFSAAVGQFVLTASLRMQTTELPPPTASPAATKKTSKTVDGVTGEIIEEGESKISSERAFADFIFGSLILHAFCINFIN